MQQLVGARCLAAGVRLSTPIFTAAAVNRARTRMLSEAHMGQVPHTPLTTGSGKFQTARLARKSPAVSWARRLSKLADGGADAAGSSWSKVIPTADEIQGAESYRYIFDTIRERAGDAIDISKVMDSITIFASLDTTKSGYLTEEELKLALSLGNIADEEVAALFDALDKDHNGRIDYFEFRRLMDELDDSD